MIGSIGSWGHQFTFRADSIPLIIAASNTGIKIPIFPVCSGFYLFTDNTKIDKFSNREKILLLLRGVVNE